MFPKFTLFNDRCPRCGRWHSLERVHRSAWVKTTFFFMTTRSYLCTGCRKHIIQLGNVGYRPVRSDSNLPV